MGHIALNLCMYRQWHMKLLLEPELPHASRMRLNLNPAGLKGLATIVESLNP